MMKYDNDNYYHLIFFISMSRQRLTITLDKSILSQLDQAIDGAKIRNRSHAIEYLLTSSFAPKVSRALILAGGTAIKFRPFTYEVPKCLLPVAGRPLLEHVINLFRQYEIRDLVISVGSLGNKIKEYFGDGSKYGVKITYVDQGNLETGTAQPTMQAKKYFGTNPFIIYYGDVLAEINLRDLVNFHLANSGLATISLTSIAKPSDWGVVSLQGTLVQEFIEKPAAEQAHSHVISAGVFVTNPEIFNYILPTDEKLESDVFPRLIKESKLLGYLFEGKWFDVSSPEIYEQAVKEWKY